MKSMKLPKPKANKSGRLKPAKNQYSNIDYPIFCLKYLKRFDKITSKEKEKFIERLYLLSRQTWQDLKLSPRHGLGTEKIERTCLNITIPQHFTPDMPTLAFRFDGKKPFIGCLSGFVFHVLVLDTKFNVYKH